MAINKTTASCTGDFENCEMGRGGVGGGRLFSVWTMGNINFYFVRHVPVLEPKGFWYGAAALIDTESAAVIKRFQQIADRLPFHQGEILFVASHYERAQETARGVLNFSASPNAGIIIDEGFAEQNYGDMTGKHHVEIRNLEDVKKYLSDIWNNAPRNGESMKMFQARVKAALDSTISRLNDKVGNVVVFCHGGTQMAALANARDVTVADVRALKKADPELDFSYMSVLHLSYDRDRSKWGRDFKIDKGIPKSTLSDPSRDPSPS